MVTPKVAVALAATAALWCWGSAATAQPADNAGSLAPVACSTPAALYAVLDDADRNHAAVQARLVAEDCESLSGRRYEVVAEKNGIVTIRLFPRDGNRAGAHLAVTLDEMVDPDLFPGSAEQPPSS
jgi:hypothetical protein